VPLRAIDGAKISELRPIFIMLVVAVAFHPAGLRFIPLTDSLSLSRCGASFTTNKNMSAERVGERVGTCVRR
jgi:hypothetical protein